MPDERLTKRKKKTKKKISPKRTVNSLAQIRMGQPCISGSVHPHRYGLTRNVLSCYLIISKKILELKELMQFKRWHLQMSHE